jgi:hypothetical protein
MTNDSRLAAISAISWMYFMQRVIITVGQPATGGWR